MLRALLELFVLYLLYKLIFDFIVPVYQTTKQVKQKVNEMQRNMNEQQANQQQHGNQYTSSSNQASPKAKSDDYIEFEEIK